MTPPEEEKKMQHGIQIHYSGLSPETKLQILKEMGFRESGPLEHDTECTSRQGSGLICDCLPGTTSWKAPGDVRRHLGEHDEARRDFAEKRQQYQNDGIGDSPGPWYRYLEKTAPRHNS
jgi:hypothetical protein